MMDVGAGGRVKSSHEEIPGSQPPPPLPDDVEMEEEERKPNININDEADKHGRPAPKKRGKYLLGPSCRPNKYDYCKGMLSKHRKKLTHMLRTFYDDHNWMDCTAVLSVLLRLTPVNHSGYSLMDFRKNFLIAMELLRRCEEAQNYTMKVKQICEIWMSKIKGLSECSKERQSIQLELVLFFLARSNFSEAHHVTKYLVQDHEAASEPKLHLLHGLTSYQIWYSELPAEMQLKDFDMQSTLHTSMILNDDISQLNDSMGLSDYHHATKKEDTLSIYYDSDSSVDDKKQIFKGNTHHNKTELNQTLHYDVHGVNTSSQTNNDRIQLSNPEKNFRELSIFDPHVRDLDASLLPIQLRHSNDDIEKRIQSHRELLTENYTDAVRHLRTALYSDPPLLPALLPFIQILLLGDQVGEALKVLTSFCHLSMAVLPFRLKARLLERFCSHQFLEISNCHEAILRREPTCSYSIERLIKMFKNGNYSSLNLLEMLALHLDATTGNCNVWDGFASCLLSIQTARQSENQLDRSSGNQAPQKCSRSFPSLKFAEKQSWKLRSRWWATRHFSKKTFLLEIQAGSWQFITYKAACACHLYGSSSVYVQDVMGHLKDKDDVELLSFLTRHIINPLLIFNPAPVQCSIPVPVPRCVADPAWTYATPFNGDKKRPKCNYCGKIIRGSGITRLKLHLAGGYSEIKMCEKCPEDVRQKVKELLRSNERKKTLL